MKDDVCDICFSSEITVSRTTPCGKTIGVECRCDDTIDNHCGDPDCEDCNESEACRSGLSGFVNGGAGQAVMLYT